MSEKDKKNKKKSVFIGAAILALIVLLIALVIWFLTYKKESYTSTDMQDSNYEALECESMEPSEPFFAFETAQRSKHDVKILFLNSNVKEMSYKYEGTFNSDTSAENAEARMHADYNKYMGANGVNAEILNPVFSVNKSKLYISLYAEAKKVNKTVAKMFFVKDEEFDKIGDFNVKTFKKFYEDKGFACKTHD